MIRAHARPTAARTAVHRLALAAALLAGACAGPLEAGPVETGPVEAGPAKGPRATDGAGPSTTEQRAPSRRELFLEPFDGDSALATERMAAVLDAYEQPSWSRRSRPRPAGGRLFWTEDEPASPTLAVLEAGASEPRRLAIDGLAWTRRRPHPPLPDPSGSWVAVPERFDGPTLHWTIRDAEGGAVLARTDTDDRETGDRRETLLWMPDGRRLIESRGGPEGHGVDLHDLVSGERRRVFDAPSGLYVHDLRLSSDGSTLCVATEWIESLASRRAEEFPDSPSGPAVLAFDLDGGPKRPLAEGSHRLVGASGPVVWLERRRSPHAVLAVDRTRPDAPAHALPIPPGTALVDAWFAGGELLFALERAQPGTDDRPPTKFPVLALCRPTGEVERELRLPPHTRVTDLRPAPDGERAVVETTAGWGGTRDLWLDLRTGHIAPIASSDDRPELALELLEDASVFRLQDDGPRGGARLEATYSQVAPGTMLYPWLVLGGSEVRVDASPLVHGNRPGLDDQAAFLAEALAAEGLQVRADAVERLRARGEL